MDELGRTVPKGMGPGAVWDSGSDAELRQILTGGSSHVDEERAARTALVHVELQT